MTGKAGSMSGAAAPCATTPISTVTQASNEMIAALIGAVGKSVAPGQPVAE